MCMHNGYVIPAFKFCMQKLTHDTAAAKAPAVQAYIQVGWVNEWADWSACVRNSPTALGWMGWL